jgi:hypothetical protein
VPFPTVSFADFLVVVFGASWALRPYPRATDPGDDLPDCL